MMLPTEKGWVLCPVCAQARLKVKLLKLEPNTEARELNLYCRKCGCEQKVNIERGRCFQSQSP